MTAEFTFSKTGVGQVSFYLVNLAISQYEEVWSNWTIFSIKYIPFAVFRTSSVASSPIQRLQNVTEDRFHIQVLCSRGTINKDLIWGKRWQKRHEGRICADAPIWSSLQKHQQVWKYEEGTQYADTVVNVHTSLELDEVDVLDKGMVRERLMLSFVNTAEVVNFIWNTSSC